MKHFSIAFLAFAFFSIDNRDLYATENISQNNKHVIGEQGGGAGLFSMFFTVIHHLAYSLKNNKVPVVYWTDECNPYHDPARYEGSTNVWEYYFEPVSHEKYMSEDYVWHLWGAPDGTGILIDPQALDETFRRGVKQAIIDRYIKVKPSILKKVDDFFQKHMKDKITVGMHIRGTDKAREVNQVAIDHFIALANDLAGRNIQFFVATDEEKILDEIRKKVISPIIFYDAYRSKDGQAVHVKAPGYSKALLGEEALIEVLLLAKCKAMIHTLSNFSFAALMFNPELKSILLH